MEGLKVLGGRMEGDGWGEMMEEIKVVEEIVKKGYG